MRIYFLKKHESERWEIWTTSHLVCTDIMLTDILICKLTISSLWKHQVYIVVTVINKQSIEIYKYNFTWIIVHGAMIIKGIVDIAINFSN